MVLTTTDVFEAISEQESLKLFRIVATSTTNLYVTDILLSKTKLSRKQFYSRMSKLTKAGLIKRIQGKYTLTTLGKWFTMPKLYLKTQLTIIGNSRHLTR